ncbi:hypothetical protein [Glutamicibacter halophytocola]|uniref:hypothetical protein n=1 Tax=Glutamicibacter halophytocola TaxID=1933880 RepID=UPI0015C56CCD|nr:hypothetical protein [Glutamicibacter halophytocola]NQD41591.1 hypothetical protein [Glutamicibacter halophytocola]
MAEHGLIVGDEVPALVVTRAVDTGEEVVLFDGGRHGYNAMFVDEYDPGDLEARQAETPFELGGCTEFAVEVEVFDNIDWDEEEDELRDEEGVLRLVTGGAPMFCVKQFLVPEHHRVSRPGSWRTGP